MTTTNQHKFVNPNPIQRRLIGRFQKRFLDVLSTTRPGSVLEVGCGEGYLLSAIESGFPELPLLGLDVNEQALAEGHRLFPTLRLEQGDIYRIDQPTRSWDVVVASEVLEHLERPADALRELLRVAQRFVLLSVPHEPWFRLGNLARGRHLGRLGNHPEHINLWTRASFRRFLDQQAIIEVTTGSFPWTIVLIRS